MAEIVAMPGRIPLVLSGDLHAIAEGCTLRSGNLDFSKKPVNVILSGPLGTGDRGWPSAFRGIGASSPAHLAMEEDLKPKRHHPEKCQPVFRKDGAPNITSGARKFRKR